MGGRHRLHAVEFHERSRVVYDDGVGEVLADGLQECAGGTENGDGSIQGIVVRALHHQVSWTENLYLRMEL